jgi:hypothetical protein
MMAILLATRHMVAGILLPARSSGEL